MHDLTLTIGSFDGVHLGHQALLKKCSFALTFTNHPLEVLGKAPPLLTTLEHRLELIEQSGIAQIELLPFTLELSKLSAEAFISQLMKKIPFTHLVLGHDAVIGHDRDGKPEKMQTLAKQFGFTLEYVQPVLVDNQVVSSSLIRKELACGNFDKVAQLLGRPYSIKAAVQHGAGKGKALGYPTANLAVSALELPPYGVYSVESLFENKRYKGIANLGAAPTLHCGREAQLEVHFFDLKKALYGKEIEVFFHSYIREERQFSSPSALKEQIHQDILTSSTKSIKT